MTRGKMAAADVQRWDDDENLVTANTKGRRAKLVTATNHILILGSCTKLASANASGGCLQPIFPATITARCVFPGEEGLRILEGCLEGCVAFGILVEVRTSIYQKIFKRIILKIQLALLRLFFDHLMAKLSLLKLWNLLSIYCKLEKYGSLNDNLRYVKRITEFWGGDSVTLNIHRWKRC